MNELSRATKHCGFRASQPPVEPKGEEVERSVN